MNFPTHRGRRLRRTSGLRALARETRLSADQLVAPLFVHEETAARRAIASLPGQARLSAGAAAEEAAALEALGVGSVLLLGLPATQDPEGSAAWAEEGAVPSAIRAIKRRVPEMVVWADVCLCEYTDHGHCGLLRGGEVDNDATLPLLARAALTYARAGHNPPLLYNKGRTPPHRKLEAGGMMLGMAPGALFDRAMTGETLQLEAGDVILFYTDGLEEAHNEKSELFGLARCTPVLEHDTHRPAAYILGALAFELERFCGMLPQEDDITAICLKIS